MMCHAEYALRDKLRANLLLKQHQVEVDLRHVGLYNDELAHVIQERPADILPLVSRHSYSAALFYITLTRLVFSSSSPPHQRPHGQSYSLSQATPTQPMSRYPSSKCSSGLDSISSNSVNSPPTP